MSTKAERIKEKFLNDCPPELKDKVLIQAEQHEGLIEDFDIFLNKIYSPFKIDNNQYEASEILHLIDEDLYQSKLKAYVEFSEEYVTIDDKVVATNNVLEYLEEAKSEGLYDD